ncbi:MAG: TIGR02444 family protein [Proteobacteria bacterium]|nr:TIGR02444 family protein [Pseudomonadota bacterium]
MNELPAHPFWGWSLEIYGRPGVEETLLDLQDRLGLDVNLLLFACWTGATGRGRLAGGEWTRLIDGTADWRANVVEPLRAIRRHLKDLGDKPGATALYETIKALELEAEHAAQLAIACMATDIGESDVAAAIQIADASANLEGCIAAAGLSLSDGDRALLISLARGCCGCPQA